MWGPDLSGYGALKLSHDRAECLDVRLTVMQIGLHPRRWKPYQVGYAVRTFKGLQGYAQLTLLGHRTSMATRPTFFTDYSSEMVVRSDGGNFPCLGKARQRAMYSPLTQPFTFFVKYDTFPMPCFVNWKVKKGMGIYLTFNGDTLWKK